MPDAILSIGVGGLAASFGLSHVAPIHNFLCSNFPRTYPTLNVILPCGRAVFLLLIFARGVELKEQQQQQRSD